MQPIEGDSAPGPGNEVFDLFTLDGGQSWQTIPNQVIVDEAATVGGVTYALIGTVQNPSPYFAVSYDGFASWQRLKAPTTARSLSATSLPGSKFARFSRPYSSTGASRPNQIGVNPDGKRLLFITYNADGTTFTINTSTDSGHSWQTLTTPMEAEMVSVQSPINGLSWSLCIGNNLNATTTFACTRDDGQHWSNLPSLPVPNNLIGLTSDGDVLAVTFSDANHTILNRFVAGNAQWQSLGEAPGPTLSLFTTTQPNVCWDLSSGTSSYATFGWYEAAYAPK